MRDCDQSMPFVWGVIWDVEAVFGLLAFLYRSCVFGTGLDFEQDKILSSNHNRQKKRINFFNVIVGPPHIPHFGPPEQEFLCLTSWEKRKEGDSHKLFSRGGLCQNRGGPKRAIFPVLNTSPPFSPIFVMFCGNQVIPTKQNKARRHPTILRTKECREGMHPQEKNTHKLPDQQDRRQTLLRTQKPE